ncbi:citrate (Si)-synthase, partial [Gammaproteobacteria bacterium]|nr:citrate (Si)-synthase [Gammaproteobacteria bacterium]
MTNKKAELHFSDTTTPLELPVISGTVGPDVVDVRSLVSKGIFTFDPGFVSTASCESEITYIDGDSGILLHRGYPIEQLAEKASFLDTCFLLLNGELPTAREKAEFENTIRYHTMVDQQIHEFFKGFPRNAHPMAMLCGAVGGLSAFYHENLDIEDADHRKQAAHRIIAKMPTLAAMVYKHGVGQPFMYPQNDMGFSANFL